MLFERIESEGLAHYSYLVGDGHEAAVIDPRRDCEAYVERATRAGLRITHILETHRNEDYVTGSCELAARTGATILHGAREDIGYGAPIQDRERLRIGRLELEAVHTPGHTPGHMSYLLHDTQGAPWVLFSGDALFAGEVGRVDLAGPERLAEMAGLLYDSIFGRILPLGDEVILCPAHGAGSACGASIAERPWTTIGIERRQNPRLRFTERARFVEQTAQALEFPPYFHRMEEVNRKGAPLLGPLPGGAAGGPLPGGIAGGSYPERSGGPLPAPPPLAPSEFAERAGNAQVLDTRMVTGFAAAHVPGALSIWLDGVAGFAGWFLSYERPILLVTETDDTTAAVRRLVRLGFDRLQGFLAGDMLAWHKAGLDSNSIGTVTVQGLCRRLDRGEDTWILDVRSSRELDEEGRIPGAHHIHVTQLPAHLGEVPRDRPVHVFCGSGLRSMIAASLLQQAGWENLTVVLGGFAGWRSARCPIRRGEGRIPVGAIGIDAPDHSNGG